MIDLTPAPERAILVGADRSRDGSRSEIQEHLAELARLADTAGAQVVGQVTQRRQAPAARYYIGPGKVAALAALVREAGASLVVFDEELSPAQGKNLEAALGVRVMDRAELILDIFAHRARTKEARMQVELAQLEYLLPRLARMWVHLSRIRGGIGLRGPGETQLETDRRMIRRKITTLGRKLKDVARHRRILRAGRRAVPTAALVGYTNAGKSSLLRALTGADAFVENRLFATLDTLARELVLSGGPGGGEARLRLVDTVGLIRKLPHHLVASFRATLEEAREADVLLHVIDASHSEWEEQLGVVDQALAELPVPGVPLIHVFNKMDQVTHREAFARAVGGRYERAVCVSALRGEVGELTDALRAVGRSRSERSG